MSKKNKNKSVKQFRLTGASISRVVWTVCVILLILAMVISAGIFTILVFFAPQSTTISQETLDQLKKSLQEQNNTQVEVQTATPKP